MARRPGTPFAAIHCASCAHEIEGCDGLHGEWKHTGTGSEYCHGGNLARPETLAGMQHRINAQLTHARRKRSA